jgi:hypothetical protein
MQEAGASKHHAAGYMYGTKEAADSREQSVCRRQQTADSRQWAVGSRPQAEGSRQRVVSR